MLHSLVCFPPTSQVQIQDSNPSSRCSLSSNWSCKWLYTTSIKITFPISGSQAKQGQGFCMHPFPVKSHNSHMEAWLQNPVPALISKNPHFIRADPDLPWALPALLPFSPVTQTPPTAWKPLAALGPPSHDTLLTSPGPPGPRCARLPRAPIPGSAGTWLPSFFLFYIYAQSTPLETVTTEESLKLAQCRALSTYVRHVCGYTSFRGRGLSHCWHCDCIPHPEKRGCPSTHHTRGPTPQTYTSRASRLGFE